MCPEFGTDCVIAHVHSTRRQKANRQARPTEIYGVPNISELFPAQISNMIYSPILVFNDG